MRYLFHVVGRERLYVDDIGEQFSSPEKAEAYAATIASELASADNDYVGFEVQVVDGLARELARVPIAPSPAGASTERG